MATQSTIQLSVRVDLDQLMILNQVRESMQADSLEEAATRLLTDALHYEKHGGD